MNEINLNDANQVPDESADVNVGLTAASPETDVANLPSQNLKSAIQREMDSRNLLIKNLEEEVQRLRANKDNFLHYVGWPTGPELTLPLKALIYLQNAEAALCSFLDTAEKPEGLETKEALIYEQMSQSLFRVRKVIKMVNACL